MKVFAQVCFTLSILLIALPLPAQQAGWQDPSPHETLRIVADTGVGLEVLDWGGSGRPLVLLAGAGNTAHVFDDFAPRLAEHFHVYGITRRGFGKSGYERPTEGLPRLAADVIAVLDALGLERPVLAGHSLAGAELSAIANMQPARVAGLVYLDAAFPYAFHVPAGPTIHDFILPSPSAPSPEYADRMHFGAFQAWSTRVIGIPTPEAELRGTWNTTADGIITMRNGGVGMAALSSIMERPVVYNDIPLPALVIAAVPHRQEPWLAANTDPVVADSAATYFATLDALTERQLRTVEEHLPQARVLRLEGSHFIFMTNEKEVIEAMREFGAELE